MQHQIPYSVGLGHEIFRNATGPILEHIRVLAPHVARITGGPFTCESKSWTHPKDKHLKNPGFRVFIEEYFMEVIRTINMQCEFSICLAPWIDRQTDDELVSMLALMRADPERRLCVDRIEIHASHFVSDTGQFAARIGRVRGAYEGSLTVVIPAHILSDAALTRCIEVAVAHNVEIVFGCTATFAEDIAQTKRICTLVGNEDDIRYLCESHHIREPRHVHALYEAGAAHGVLLGRGVWDALSCEEIMRLLQKL